MPAAKKAILCVDLLHNLVNDGLNLIKTEHLCTFDGEAGYALGQGQ